MIHKYWYINHLKTQFITVPNEYPYHTTWMGLKWFAIFCRSYCACLVWTVWSLMHYNDVIMSAMRLKSPASRLFTQPFIQAQIKENTKAPRHWSLCGEFTTEFPAQRTSDAENVSIWCRHHGIPICFSYHAQHWDIANDLTKRYGSSIAK